LASFALGRAETIVGTDIVPFEPLSKASNGPIGPEAADCLGWIGPADTSASGRTENSRFFIVDIEIVLN
jgi:hypothetical protein